MDSIQDRFARHGGVHFTNNVTPQEINEFVSRLSAGKRDSLFEVLHELNEEGLITIHNDHVFTDGEGKLGGNNDC
ncbi:MAG TPA: hypothetical protein VJ824_08525 [Bacillota bacterium]|nr:hypothetical protein [Bacillota bacterium]